MTFHVFKRSSEPLPDLMDIRQLAKYLLVSEDAAYKYAATHVVPGFKLGNQWRFSKKAIDAWIDAQCKAQQQ